MNAEPEKQNHWQLSLADVLTFVFAMAVWGLLVTQEAILERQYITFVVMLAAGACAFVARQRKRRAVLLLIAIFLFTVAGSHTVLRARQLKAMNTRLYRQQLLWAVQLGMQMYAEMLHAEIPPDTSIDAAGAELHRALLTNIIDARGRQYGPFVFSKNVRVEKGVTYLTGGKNARLIWARMPDGKGILIDTGPDNLPGGTLSATGIYTPGPVDANGDGTNDGADDMAVFPNSPEK